MKIAKGIHLMSNRNRMLTFLAAVAIALPISARTTTGQYTLTILGRVQHNYLDSTFNASSINDNGVVAGDARVRVPDNFQRTIRGVLWQQSTVYTILETISEQAGFDSAATWINNLGIAVGVSAENTTNRGYVQVPVIFTASGIVDLGLRNAGSGVATCINDASQVVGNLMFDSPFLAYQAFLYQNGVMTLLGYPVPTIGYSKAFAINNDGLIVGSAIFSPGASPHAACYANGAWIDLGTLGSGSDFRGTATSVNNSGAIVGLWSNTNGGGVFIYQNGQMADLNAPQRPGNPSINNAGQIVQGNFIYQNGVWQDLNDLDLGDGWTFSQAFGINNHGVIIGEIFRLVNRVFQFRSAVLTPVSPAQQPAIHEP
jgi:probable HAF family extracellular repeat protein